MSASGTSALTTWLVPCWSMPSIRPRREERSPVTAPRKSSGTVTVTSMTGSSSTGLAARIAFLIAMDPAILKAISEESTSWYDP